MTRGETDLNKIHYQGSEEDFLIFVDDVAEYQKWKGDHSVAPANFMANFSVYITHKQGTQGKYDSASKSTMSNEFGTDNIDDVIKLILEKGTLETTQTSGRQGDRNINSGPRVNH